MKPLIMGNVFSRSMFSALPLIALWMWVFSAAAIVCAEEDQPVEKIDPNVLRHLFEGQIVGVGVFLEPAEGGARVKSVMANSPAQRAGIPVGSLITAIDGKLLAGLTIDKIRDWLRGPEDAKVTLTMKLPDGSARTVELTRSVINVPSVESRELGGGLFLIHIFGFNRRTPDEVEEQLGQFKTRGAKGFILDLRGPSLGVPASARAVADLLVPAGQPLWGVHLKDRSNDEQYVARGGAFAQLPCALLIDGNTQGSGMLVAYAIKQNHRAKLLGQKTGPFLPTRRLAADGDGATKLVESGCMLSAAGESLSGQRIEPDIAVAADAGGKALLEQAIAVLRESSSEKSKPAPEHKTNDRLRTWTDATGKYRIEAEFRGVVDGKVRLKKTDGKTVSIPLDKLCKEDREFIEKARHK